PKDSILAKLAINGQVYGLNGWAWTCAARGGSRQPAAVLHGTWSRRRCRSSCGTSARCEGEYQHKTREGSTAHSLQVPPLFLLRCFVALAGRLNRFDTHHLRDGNIPPAFVAGDGLISVDLDA